MLAPAIDSFTGKNRFLSNFHRVLVFFEGKMFPTVEHAYQAAEDMQRDRSSYYFNGSDSRSGKKNCGAWARGFDCFS